MDPTEASSIFPEQWPKNGGTELVKSPKTCSIGLREKRLCSDHHDHAGNRRYGRPCHLRSDRKLCEEVGSVVVFWVFSWTVCCCPKLQRGDVSLKMAFTPAHTLRCLTIRFIL
jgi:hypothetical protein